MKHAFFALLLGFFAETSAQHTADVSFALFTDQIDQFSEGQHDRTTSNGVGVTVIHSLDHPDLKFIGSNIALNYSEVEGLMFSAGIVVRSDMFNNFLQVELIPPMLNMSLNRSTQFEYNTPFGVGINLFRGKVKLGIRELMYKKAIVSRLSINYNFVQ